MNLSQDVIDPEKADEVYQPLVLPLSQIIENQATINIITLGHVAHGKSTLVKAITDVKTQKHKSELERNITIYLGYANAKIWKCPETGKLVSTPSHAKTPIHYKSGKPYRLKKHISFLDVPGHESLMSTMISGSHNIDLMFLLMAGNDKVIPQPQTYEHLLAISTIKAAEIKKAGGDRKDTRLDNLIILQNKLDLIDREATLENLKKIKDFVKDSPVADAPIVPISAQLMVNMEPIYDYLVNHIPDSLRDSSNYNKPAQLTIIRSFNVNKPSYPLEKLRGGVVGGSLNTGALLIGDYIEIRPGISGKNKEGQFICQPLVARVCAMFSEKKSLQVAVSGGLIGVGLSLDPGLTKNNLLVGQVMGHIGTLPGIYRELTAKYHRINRLSEGLGKVLKKGERLKMCVHATTVFATVVTNKETKKLGGSKVVKLILEAPVCFNDDDKITILRNSGDNRWRLDGYVDVLEKVEVEKDHLTFPEEYEKHLSTFKRRQIKVIDDTEESEEESEEGEEGTKRVYGGTETWKPDYMELLENIPFKTHEKQKISLPPPKVEKRTKYSIFTNFMDYVEQLNFYQGEDETGISEKSVIKIRTHLYKYLVEELSTTCSINGENHMVITGKFFPGQIESILSKYLKQFLLCKNCHMLNSFLYRKDGLKYQQCNYCNSLRTF